MLNRALPAAAITLSAIGVFAPTAQARPAEHPAARLGVGWPPSAISTTPATTCSAAVRKTVRPGRRCRRARSPTSTPSDRRQPAAGLCDHQLPLSELSPHRIRTVGIHRRRGREPTWPEPRGRSAGRRASGHSPLPVAEPRPGRRRTAPALPGCWSRRGRRAGQRLAELGARHAAEAAVRDRVDALERVDPGERARVVVGRQGVRRGLIGRRHPEVLRFQLGRQAQRILARLEVGGVHLRRQRRRSKHHGRLRNGTDEILHGRQRIALRHLGELPEQRRRLCRGVRHGEGSAGAAARSAGARRRAEARRGPRRR